MIPNPNNNFVPREGQTVRVVGNCHPSLLGRIVKVTRVDPADSYAELEWVDAKLGVLSSGGELGGLEPVGDMP